MRKLALVLCLLAAGCAHKAYRETSECEALSGADRLACSACTVQNKAEGWLGVYEYRPDAKEGDRCVRVK